MDRNQYRREIGPVSGGYRMEDMQFTVSHKSIEESLAEVTNTPKKGDLSVMKRVDC